MYKLGFEQLIKGLITYKGQIITVKITQGNIDDRVAAVRQKLKGKCCADKGYISRAMFKKLYKQGLIIITGIRKYMKIIY